MGIIVSYMPSDTHSIKPAGRRSDPVTGKTVFKPGVSNSGCLDAWVLSLTLAGQCDYTLQSGLQRENEANKLTLEPRQILVIRPETTQHWQVPLHAAGWTVIWATFNPRQYWLDWLDWPDHTKGQHGYYHLTLSDPAAARHAKTALERMHKLNTSGVRLRRALALNALEEALLWCQDEHSRQRESMDARVTLALRYLAEHLHEPVSLPALAAACHTSRARLAALFMRDVGVPPMRYLEQQRMARAAELLEMTPLAIKQIAQQVGYNDSHHFAKRFVATYQQTPSAYRQAQQVQQAGQAQ